MYEKDYRRVESLLDSSKQVNPKLLYSGEGLWKAVKMIKDGLNVEFMHKRDNDFNFAEIANIMYISALEVLARNYLTKSDEICKKCETKIYKISAGVRDLTSKVMKSEHFVKLVKDNYSLRSLFLHEGVYYSNSYLNQKNYVPSLRIGQESFVDGPWIDINNQDSIRGIPTSIIKRRIDFLNKK